jgi:hypothetical protein
MAQRNGKVHTTLGPDRRSKASHLAVWRMLLKGRPELCGLGDLRAKELTSGAL